ncbi:MAG: phospholipid carrier-dependent glycosyltransferase [Bacteroidetes bacterium]|nr:phospholipid carrier-dependent glycosyltransferase [Bacteroidota bacterium]
MKLPSQKAGSRIILLFHILVMILYHVFGYIGHYGYDDMHYARLAWDLLHGSLDYNDHFVFRTPLIVFTAISYFLFGISDFSSALPTLIITSGILLVVYQILKDEGYLTLIIGLSLTLFSNWLIHYSGKIMLDNYLAFAIILAIYILYRYRYKSDKVRPGLFALLFAGVLLFGFTAKETIVLIIPFLLFVFLSDLAQKNSMKFWGYVLVYGFLILALYFIFIRILTGSFTKRFEAISGNSYLNLCSYDMQSNLILLKRIAYEFFNLTVYQGLFTAFIFIIPVLFRDRIKRFLIMKTPYYFFVSATVILILSSNFMSISFTHYIPLCLDPRHYLFLVPVAAIPASQLIAGFIHDKSNAWGFIISSALTAAWSWFLPGNSFWTIYLPVAVILFLFFIVKNGIQKKNWFVGFLVMVFMAEPFAMVIYAQKIRYHKQKEVIFDHLLSLGDKYYVITDEAQSRICNYYCRFDESKFKFLKYNHFSFDTLTDRKIIFLNNWYTLYLSGLTYHELPYYARQSSDFSHLIFKDDELEISISEVRDLAALVNSEKNVYSTCIDFENDVPNWYIRENSVTDSTCYRGSKCNKVVEYSATFWYPVDSLVFDPGDKILIRSSFYGNFDDKTGSRLVITLDEGSNSYLWEGLEVNKFLKAYSNWWQINYEYELPAEKIRKGSVLRIYLWNTDKKVAFLDDFTVEIRRITH